MPIALKALHCV